MEIKKMAVIVAGVLAIAGTAFAGQYAGGMGCNFAKDGEPVNVEAFKKFQDETTSLRNEMMLKKVELRNEGLKTPLDEAKISALHKEMNELKTKISAIAKSNGLPEMGNGKGCCGGDGKSGMGKGMKGAGRGMGM